MSCTCPSDACPLPVATLFSSEAVLHDVEELLLGVDDELGVDGPAVGVGGVSGDMELGANVADFGWVRAM